ncbi:MAG: Gfo/Idh/MocA family oxidoreductase [Betaproteobacteria bacterium]
MSRGEALLRPAGWGILGTGTVAREFAAGLGHIPAARLVAVGSRDLATAQAFAAFSGAVRAHGSYEALVADPAVDVVYIATPHVFHHQHCLLALQAGKAVLCEKPFASDAGEAREVAALAKQKNLFCMEAMWMHFVPAMRYAIDRVATGDLGPARMLMADFGVPTVVERGGRFFSAELGGGALMDRGVYPLALAWRLFGRPDQVESVASLAATGVDEQCAIALRYPGGELATLSATLTGYAANQAVITCSGGRLTIGEPLCRPDRVAVARAPVALRGGAQPIRQPSLKDRIRANPVLRRLRGFLPGRERTQRIPYLGNGYTHEAIEVMRCLAAGETQSAVWPLEHTLGVMDTLDRVRACWRH